MDENRSNQNQSDLDIPDFDVSNDTIADVDYSSSAPSEAELTAAEARADADARISAAEAKAKVAALEAEAEVEAAQQKAKAKVAAEKSKRRSKTVKRLFRKSTLIIMLIVVAIVIAVSLISAAVFQLSKPTEFINSSQIMKIVAVNELSVVDFDYEGVAIYTGDGHEDNPLHIHYTSKVKATFNPGDIKFEINDEAKTVTPILPQINISNPKVDDRIDILEGEEQNIDMASVYNACEADAAAEVQEKSNITEMATNNARKAIEGLTMNLLQSKGYTLTWPTDTPNQSQPEGDDSNE